MTTVAPTHRQRLLRWALLALVCVCLFGIVFALYFPILAAPLYYDTKYFLLDSSMRHWRQTLSFFRLLTEPRSLGQAFLWLNWLYSGLDPSWLRFFNTLIHAINATLIFVFLGRVTRAALPDTAEQKTKNILLSWAVALFFAASPVALYAVEAAIQRYVLLSLMFLLIALLLFFEHVNRPKWWLATLSVLGFYVALQIKEHAVMAPVVFVLLAYLVETSWRKVFERHGLIFIVLALISLKMTLQMNGLLFKVYEPFAAETLMSLRTHLTPNVPEAAMSENSVYALSIFNQMALYFRYVYLWIMPDVAKMALVTPQPFYRDFMSLPLILGGVGYLGSGVIAFFGIQSRNSKLRLLCFFYASTWVLFWTEFSAVRFHENFLLYRSYIWMWGTCGLVWLFLYELANRLKKVFAVCLILSLLCLQLMAFHDRCSVFHNPVDLWLDVVKKIDFDDWRIPSAYQAAGNLAAAYGEDKNYAESVRYYNLSAKLNPDYDKPWFGIGASLFFEGKFNEAIPYFKRAIKLNPLYKQAYYFYGLSLESQNQIEAANHQYELAINLLSEIFEYEALIKFAETAIQIGHFDKANKAYEELLEKYPDRTSYRTNYALNLFHQNRLKEALNQLEDLIRIDPSNSKAFLYLGHVLLKVQNYEQALKFYLQSAALDKNSVFAWHGVAMSYLSLGDVDKAIPYLQKVLELDANFEASQQALDWIGKQKMIK